MESSKTMERKAKNRADNRWYSNLKFKLGKSALYAETSKRTDLGAAAGG